MIADIINNNKLNAIVSELFIRGRKLNISLVFITQSFFKVPKDIHKDIFACLFSIHNIISLSCHEQVCLSGLRFERYFSHHRAR